MFKKLLASTLCLAAVGTADAQDDEIIIGAATSLSGWMAVFDTGPTRAAEQAVEDLNAKGGLLGKKIRLIHTDVKTDPALTAKAAQDFVARGAKLIITACEFGMGAPASVVAQKAGVLAFSTCGADIKGGDLTIGNNVFSMATDAGTTGRVLAEWGTKKKGWKTAYVLLDTFIEYDKALCRGFVDQWKKIHGPAGVVLEDTFKNADASIASQISRYKALPKPADTMILCSVPPGLASAIRQIRAAGINIPIMDGTGGTSSAWQAAIPGLSDYYSLNYSADGGVKELRPDAEAFRAKYEKRWNEQPASGETITGYSVVQAWSTAVTRAKTTDTDKVRGELEKFNNEPLIVGPTSFSPKLHMDQVRPLLIQSTNGGKTEPLGYYDMRKGDYVKWW